MQTTVTITRIGGPTVLIEIDGVRLLTDPTFDPPGSRYQLGPVTIDKTAGPALGVNEIGAVDAVLLSHDQHPDNLDEQGRRLLDTAPVVLTTPSSAERLGGSARGLQPGESVRVASQAGAVDVMATEALHGPEHLRGALGEVTGFLAAPHGGGPAVYVSGDNVDEAAFALANGRADVRLALVHGGAARLDLFGGTLLSASTEHIRAAAAALPAAQVAVIHDTGWSHLTEDVLQVGALLGHALSGRLLDLEPGKPVDIALAATDARRPAAPTTPAPAAVRQ